jgi:hypothetical protein
MSVLRELNYVEGMLGCLTAFASLALAQGQITRAAGLLGAVTALLRSPGISWHDHVVAQLAYERATESLRPALAQPRWAEAWARGEAMSLAEAVEFALAGPQEP